MKIRIFDNTTSPSGEVFARAAIEATPDELKELAYADLLAEAKFVSSVRAATLTSLAISGRGFLPAVIILSTDPTIAAKQLKAKLKKIRTN